MAIQNMLDFTAKLNIIFNGNENFKKASSSLRELQDNTKKLQDVQNKFASANSLRDVISSLENTRAAHQANLDIVKSSASITRQRHADLQQTFNAENQKLQALKNSHGKSSKEYKTQSSIVRKLAADLKATGREISSLEKQEKSLSEQINSSNSKIQERKNQLANDYTRALNQAGISEEKFIARQNQIAAALANSEKAQAKFQSIKQNLSWQNINDSVIKPAVTAYASIQPFVKISADFEQQMARVKAVAFAGGTEKELSDWRELVQQAAQLGADTQFTSIQAGQAMENLARAGMSKDAIKNTMPALLDMAAAEGMSIDQAANILANVQGGMGMNASDSQKIADILAYTSGASNLSIAGLGEALSKVASTAKGQNVSLEQVSAYIGTLANKGFGMEVAGTGLTNVFRRIANKEKSAKLSALGVRTQTRNGDMVEIPEIMKQLNNSLGDKGPKEQLAKLSEIFGEQAGIVQALMQATKSGELQALEKNIKENYSGRASAMANINLDTLSGQITLLSSAWDGFKTNIGDTFNPIIRAGVETLTSALSKISALMKEFPTLSKGITLAFGAFTSGKLLFGVASITKNILALPGAFLSVVQAGKNVAGVLGSISNTAPKISGAFSALASPITGSFNLLKSTATGAFSLIMAHPIIAGGAALIAGVTLLVKNWDNIKSAVGSACDFAKEKWQTLSDWWASWSFPNVWDSLKNSFISVCDSIKNVWQSVCDFFASLNPFKGMGEKISGLVSSASSEQQVKNSNLALSSWGIPELHAKGGIFSQPHMGVIAENGPEAIIPLSDKARGVPLLLQAANSLGLSHDNISLDNFSLSQSQSERRQNNNVLPADVYSRNDDRRYNRYSSSFNASPVINISVNNSSPSDDDYSLSEKISRAVLQAWDNIQQQQARISFA